MNYKIYFNTISSRAACASQFNDYLNEHEMDCQDVGGGEDPCEAHVIDVALALYDDCCANGGSGCP